MMFQATQDAKQSIDYGTKVAGGVTPGKDGEHLGLPLFPTVRAVSDIRPNMAGSILIGAMVY